jgi:hypothetical protein
VAPKFRHVRFLLLDAPGQPLPHGPNIQRAVFRAEEAGYLAGYLAALMERRRGGKHVISAVGGIPFAGVTRWIVGYRAGAKKADPEITVRIDYSQDFANPVKCRRVALAQIARGSGVVFMSPGAWVTIASWPSAFRSPDTCTWSAVDAVSGGEPSHSSSISRSLETTRFGCSRSNASNARCLEPPRATRRPFSSASSEPRIRNSTLVVTLL